MKITGPGRHLLRCDLAGPPLGYFLSARAPDPFWHVLDVLELINASTTTDDELPFSVLGMDALGEVHAVEAGRE